MRCFALILILFLSNHAIMANPLDDDAPQFNVKLANSAFDHINIQLSTQNLNRSNLDAAIETLSGFTQQAEQCVTDEKKRLANITALIPQNASANDKNNTGADLLYLSNEKRKIANRLSECRLFAIRAKEAIDAYKSTLAQLTQDEALTRSLPLWEVINQLIVSPPVDAFNSLLQTPVPAALKSPLMWFASIFSALILSFIVLIRLRKTYFSKHFLHIKKIHARDALLVFMCVLAGVVFAYLSLYSPETPPSNLILGLSEKLFFYLLATGLLLFVSKMKRTKALCHSVSIDNDSCRSVLLVILSFYTLASIGDNLTQLLKPNDLLLQLVHCLFLLSMLTTGIYYVYYLCYSHRHLSFIKHHKRFIRLLGLLTFLLCIGLTISGYHALALRIALAGLITFILLLLMILMFNGINKVYFAVNNEQSVKDKVIHRFGYKPEQAFTELLILKTVTQLVIMMVGLFLIVQSWGFATYYLERACNQLFDGIHLGSVTIYPARIVLGVIAYCLLFLLFRSLSTWLSRHQQFEDEEETQVAIASICTYIGFTLALISALLIAGFDFTGLAIVAGALSVGIGLGLQSIVNNFVSGLILLIEKPIKPGDRINIDGVEGFVKKIRVRSTHILTPAQEDIIVPNSDLITRRVTNYVYSNKQFSIQCEINVPLGSDTTCVRDLLLQAANNHEDVIKTGRNKPYVLFSSFGEKSLLFKLCCLIKDVNKKLLVQSDLNFAIDQLLREKKI